MDEATDYLDPGLSDTAEGWGVMWNVYLPLLGYRHVNGKAGAKLVPYLATSLPRISRDRRTYRLTLRDGLSYSDGTRSRRATSRRRSSETSSSIPPAPPSSATSSGRRSSRSGRT